MIIDGIDKLLAVIDKGWKNQTVVNQMYRALTHEIISEMDKNIPISDGAKLNRNFKKEGYTGQIG